MSDSTKQVPTVSEVDNRTIYQPLHPSVRSELDPEYVAFHDEYAQYVEPEYTRPWSPSLRTRCNWPYAGSEIVEVGTVHDVRLGEQFDVRIFTPATKQPTEGWPLLIWFHGGGFCVGNIDSDADLCSRACQQIDCVVMNVDYRLAPEHPFPAAVEDVETVLTWANDEATCQSLGIDRSRIVLGGASAGGNLAAVGALVAADLGISLISQLLVAPVIDNTATLKSSWACRPFAPWLTPPRMTWFRNMYLLGHDPRDWKASPSFAPQALLTKLPKTYLFIPKQDMLCAEVAAYGKLLQKMNIPVITNEYEGMPHSMMALSGVLTKGRKSMNDVIQALRESLAETG